MTGTLRSQDANIAGRRHGPGVLSMVALALTTLSCIVARVCHIP